MENNNTTENNQLIEVTPEESRLFTVYSQITRDSDVAIMLAEFIGSVDKFNYGLIEANRINDRQGKNRASYTLEQRSLMRYLDDSEFDFNANEKAEELAIYIINILLSDKQELPNKPKFAKGILSYVKSLYCIILSQELYNLLPRLNTPSYVKPYVDNITTKLHNEQETVFYEWLNYVETHESEELADYTRELGYQYWSNKMSPGSLFGSRYKDYIVKIRDYDALRNAFASFRSRCLKVTRNIKEITMIEMFELTKAQFDAAKKRIMNDIQELNSIDNQAITLKLLIYGK